MPDIYCLELCGVATVENGGGNREGEHGPRARCSPLDCPASRLRPAQLTRLARSERIRQLPIVVEVAARRPRAALYAARLVEPPPERPPRATPWRVRPPEMAGWPAKPAASDVVAHAPAPSVALAKCVSCAAQNAALAVLSLAGKSSVRKDLREKLSGTPVHQPPVSTNNLPYPNRANHRSLSRPPSRRQPFAI